MAIKPSKHIIAARNPFFGTSYFLILPLPDGWRITRSYLSPDVNSFVKRENLTWVEAGQTDQIVFQPQRRLALDLTIQVKRGKHTFPGLKDTLITSQGIRLIGGHQADYCAGELKRGLFWKKVVNILAICVFCPELKRTLFLNFTGMCQESELKEIFDSVSALECH